MKSQVHSCFLICIAFWATTLQAKTDAVPEQVLTFTCKGATNIANELDSSAIGKISKAANGVYVAKKLPIPKFKERWKLNIGGGYEYESTSAAADATRDNHNGDHEIFVTDQYVKFDGHYVGGIGPTPVSGQDSYSLSINRTTGEWIELKSNDVNWTNGTHIRISMKTTGTCKEVASK